jgi:hypothetical protein
MIAADRNSPKREIERLEQQSQELNSLPVSLRGENATLRAIDSVTPPGITILDSQRIMKWVNEQTDHHWIHCREACPPPALEEESQRKVPLCRSGQNGVRGGRRICGNVLERNGSSADVDSAHSIVVTPDGETKHGETDGSDS